MAFFDWEQKYSVLVPDMDTQHKRLLDIINRFFEASQRPPNKVENQKLLQELISYTVTHFNEEETFMEQVKYPGIVEHKARHKALVEKALQIKKDFDAGDGTIHQDVLAFLKSWLVTHIQGQDLKYGQHVKGQKAS